MRRSRRRRRGRSAQGPEELFAEAQAAYKRGRADLAAGDLEAARVQAIRVGEFALKANRKGLDPKRYGVALRAQSALIDAVQQKRAA
jgi:hypothetical protein